MGRADGHAAVVGQPDGAHGDQLGRGPLPVGEMALADLLADGVDDPHGVLAPHARWRGLVVAYGRADSATSPVPPSGDTPREDAHCGAPLAATAPARPRYRAWAELMRRAFDLDVLACPRCGGRLRLLGTIDEPRVVQRLLARLELPTDPVRPDSA